MAIACVSCAPDFDTARATPPRGTLGRELFGVVCDRVGAQALREDVTGASFHDVCHADLAGKFKDTVDASKLIALDPNAVDDTGHAVSLDQQTKNRAHRIARIEALARRRDDFVRAIDAAIPDETIGIKDLAAADPRKTCDPPGRGRSGEAPLKSELRTTLGKMIDLYNDRTIPMLTEGLADVMEAVRADPETQAALARFDARQGYRPPTVAIGVARPAFSYPRLVPLANALLALLSSGGKSSREMQALLATLHEELRTSFEDPLPAPLTAAIDPLDPSRKVLSRPRGTLELSRQILMAQDAAFTAGGPRYVVLRDPRGVASVVSAAGKLPAPFVDADNDGLPDLDALGQFVTSNGAPPPTPFFSIDGTDANGRDPFGRIPIYAYVDTKRTFMASLLRDVAPLVDPDPAHDSEALMGILAGLPVLFGSRDADATSRRTYAGKPDVTLDYKAFHPEDSPLVDLVYAIGQVLASDTTDDTLALFRELADKHPAELARLVGIGLEIKAIADKHPEAQIPRDSTLWDELLDTFVKMAQAPGVFEDLVRAFGKDETLRLRDAFVAYLEYKDELTYDKANLNGPAFNLTTQSVAPLKTKVDRSLPDTGANRSALQRFMQLLHDANGLAACTKKGAVAHVVWKGVKLDYPTDFLAQAACVFLTGNGPPSELPLCGILRIENVAALLLDVALGRAKFDIRDPCLAALVSSPLTGIVGGADAFLESVSGIQGFSTHPTVNGVARLTYYDTPHDGLPGDNSNPQTMRFLKDILDPVPSMVCPPTPFTDPSDGKVVDLRTCGSFKDTLRGRDDNALFPLEQLDFVKNVQPLAAAFADHGASLLFVELFDTMHLHWGSPRQSAEECTKTGNRATNPVWCSQDGAVSYEPLLAEALKTDLFQTLHDTLPVLQSITVQHCTAKDAKGLCTAAAPKDGVSVLADAARTLLDPRKNQGLRDRRGNLSARRNDGTTNAQVTPIYLLIDALNGIDTAFASYASLHPGDKERQAKWRSARSRLVDTFFAVSGTGASSRFQNAAVPKILPTLVDALREQVAAHCMQTPCAWAKTELAKKLADIVQGPTFASTLDVVDAIRTDDAARTELERLLQFLLSSPDAEADAATISAAVDLLQWTLDDANLVPLLHGISAAFGRAQTGADGKVTRRSLADATIELLARVLAQVREADGTEICAKEIDPNHALVTVLGHLMTPMGPNEPAPIELLIDVIADVNRARPETTTKLAAEDYASISFEVKDFCVNPSRGLEQVYEVIREATLP